MTPEQKKNYLDGNGHYCPYCGSDMISTGPTEDIDDHILSKPIKCNLCHREWLDIFKLVDVKFSGRNNFFWSNFFRW